jgi:hypothetical protein
MRTGLAVLFCACVGLPASSAVAGAASDAAHEAVVAVEASAPAETRAPRAVSMVSARIDGGRWLTATDGLWSSAPDGRAQLHIDLAARGFGNALALAADPYDGTAWIATDASLLLHFALDGSLVQGATLPASANALAVDLDGSTWVIAHASLVHSGRNGAWLETRPLDLAADERATALAIDALRDRIWIATTRALYPLAKYDDTARAVVLRGNVGAMAIDQRTGTVLAIVDGSLVAIDEDMLQARPFDHVLVDDEQAIAVLHDADAGAFVVETDNSVLRMANDGRVLERRAAGSASMLAATPFRVYPTLALLRPPGGGAITEAHAEIVLRAGAICNGVVCDPPEAYLHRLHIDAALGGISLGEARIDDAGRVTFPLRPAMMPGVNELTATATDAFGHAVELGPARWALLTDASGAGAANRPSSEADADTATTKAANKAPTVSLTAPVSGATFSAGSSIALGANAADPDGSIAKVEFYRGGSTLIGVATTSPYRYVWTAAAAGSYSLTAKAYDNRNGTAISSPVTIVVVNNQLPTVALTSPVSQGFARVGTPVTVAATASDPDGTIANTEFFDGSVSLGTDMSAPYEMTWTPSSPGLHSISARATDDRGGVGISSSVDIIVADVPVVIVTAPVACSSIAGPLDMLLTADAISASGAIASVEFFDNGASVGTVMVAPWRAVLLNASIGVHAITALATDEQGLTTLSRPSTFTVRGANQPPNVAITAPTEGSHFPFRAAVTLTATAADADGTITAVDFRIGSSGGTLIGRATSAPYTISWPSPAVGSYAVVAVAYDDRNAATTSAAVHLTVDPNVLPVIAVTAPVADARYTAPATVTLTASATDSDGSIAKVDFYAGATLVGSSTTPPYSVVWSNVGPGAYSLSAKATDNAGGVTTSTTVAITVVSNVPPSVALTAPVPGSQYFAPATISLAANAADSDGTVASVAFYANGTLIGTSTAAPYGMVWDGVAAGIYSLSANATDTQGGITTSAQVSIIVNAGITVSAAPSLDGSVVDDDSLLVTGTIKAPPNSGVLVNGAIAQIDLSGNFYANNVPLALGTNAVTIVVSSQGGQSARQTVSLSSTGAGPFVVNVSPADGFAPLPVTFEITNRANRAFERVEFDLDGDGSSEYTANADQFVNGVLNVAVTYPAGTFRSTITVYDINNVVIYTTTRVITARTIQQHDDLLRGVYTGMLALLKANRIPAALNAITGDMQEKYAAVFTALGSALPAAVDTLGTLQPNTFAADRAEYVVVRDTPDGPQGFLIDFLRGADGVWRIDGM